MDKITPEARQRLLDNPPPETLRAMRELAILLLKKKATLLQRELDNDQADISTAFDADRLTNPKGWEQDHD